MLPVNFTIPAEGVEWHQMVNRFARVAGWHAFRDGVSLCRRWLLMDTQPGQRWHGLPACTDCMKERYGLA